MTRTGTPMQAIRYALSEMRSDEEITDFLQMWEGGKMGSILRQRPDFPAWCAAHPDQTEEEGR